MDSHKHEKSLGFDVDGRRVAARRARDPYFDALCEAYADLDRLIAAQGTTAGMASIETERLKRQRAGCLDTILFMLDDASGSHRRAA